MIDRKKWMLFVCKIIQKLAIICPSDKCKLSVEDAESILRDRGYVFQPIFPSIPPLKERLCDLSLIVPVYNSESFLPKCLESLCGQKTNCHYEIICINDGSSDGSLRVLEQFAKQYKNLKVYTQENRGISAARNKGIELSTGKYIGFIDNDDTVSFNYVQTLLDLARKTNADIIQCGYTEKTHDGILLKETKVKEQVIEKADKRKLFKYVQGYVWSGCFKSDMFENVRFPLGFWYEDMITRMLLMRISNKFAIVGESLYHKTIHKQNASKRLWKNDNIKAVDQYWLAQQCAEYAQENLCLPPDELLYNTLLTEWSQFLWGRMRGLPKVIQKSVFILAANNIQKMNFNEGNCYHPQLQCVLKSFRNKNFNQWRLLSFSMLLKSVAQ